MFGIVYGICVGKLAIHYFLFCKVMKLKLFTIDGQGSWMVGIFNDYTMKKIMTLVNTSNVLILVTGLF